MSTDHNITDKQCAAAFGPDLMKDLRRLEALILGARGVAIQESSWTNPQVDDRVVRLLDDAIDLVGSLIYPENDDGSGVQCYSNRVRSTPRQEVDHAA